MRYETNCEPNYSENPTKREVPTMTQSSEVNTAFFELAAAGDELRSLIIRLQERLVPVISAKAKCSSPVEVSDLPRNENLCPLADRLYDEYNAVQVSIRQVMRLLEDLCI